MRDCMIAQAEKQPEHAVAAMGWLACPACGTPNNDDWPIEVDGKIVSGGCQECWEKQSDAAWWKMVVAMDTLQANENGDSCGK